MEGLAYVILFIGAFIITIVKITVKNNTIFKSY